MYTRLKHFARFCLLYPRPPEISEMGKKPAMAAPPAKALPIPMKAAPPVHQHLGGGAPVAAAPPVQQNLGGAALVKAPPAMPPQRYLVSIDPPHQFGMVLPSRAGTVAALRAIADHLETMTNLPPPTWQCGICCNAPADLQGPISVHVTDIDVLPVKAPPPAHSCGSPIGQSSCKHRY